MAFSHRMDRVVYSLIGLAIILLNSCVTNGTPFIYNDSLEGSGQWGSGSMDLTPTPSLSSFLSDSVISTSIDGEKHTSTFLHQMVDFLQENLLLIIVITTLLLLTFTITCSAMVLSHRRKVSAYYPCAFPSKMYVDERDKTGGARFFNEVPENVPTNCSEEPLNSAKQLQEDIMLATRNLRTPLKTPCGEKNEAVADDKPEDESLSPQCDKSQEDNSGLLEDNTTNQSVVEHSVEESSLSRSQNSVPVCDMEKTDLTGSGPPEGSKHPSEPEIQEDMDKQEVDSLGTSVITEEKTAF